MTDDLDMKIELWKAFLSSGKFTKCKYTAEEAADKDLIGISHNKIRKMMTNEEITFYQSPLNKSWKHLTPIDIAMHFIHNTKGGNNL